MWIGHAPTSSLQPGHSIGLTARSIELPGEQQEGEPSTVWDFVRRGEP